jgi:hypothetical protein
VLVTAALAVPLGAVAAHADELLGTADPDTITGSAADDALYGGAGADILRGLGGDDDLDGGPGNDELDGGPGEDAVSYAGATAGVTVTLRGEGRGGADGESDTLTAIEDAYGGARDDTLTGSSGANTLDGGDGNDTIEGGAGTDGLYGGDGDDVLRSRDGAVDTVDCGGGDDLVDADAEDIVTGCERRGKGTALPSARTTGTVSFDSSTRSGRTTITRLTVADVTPATASVRVLCRGGGCPFRSRAFPLAAGGADLTPAFRGRPLATGARVVVLVQAPDTLGKFAGLTMRRRQAPRTQFACVAPGKATAIRCPSG